MIKTLTCIECPVGCEIRVETENDEVKSVQGNSCPRGKMYAESEVICPKRVVTSVVRAENGEMIPVKTPAVTCCRCTILWISCRKRLKSRDETPRSTLWAAARAGSVFP